MPVAYKRPFQDDYGGDKNLFTESLIAAFWRMILKLNGIKAMRAEQTKYGFSKTVDIGFDEAIEKTRAALKEEGFGVLSEIDLKEKLKEKLDVDFRRYTILGACNPSLAYKTLQEELEIGLLLPCNVIVYEADDKNTSVISAVDAKAMLSVVGNATLDQVAGEVNERLQRVLSSL